MASPSAGQRRAPLRPPRLRWPWRAPPRPPWRRLSPRSRSSPPSSAIGKSSRSSSSTSIIVLGVTRLCRRAKLTTSARRRRPLWRLMWRPPWRLASCSRCPRRHGHRARAHRGTGRAPLAARRVNSTVVNAAVRHTNHLLHGNDFTNEFSRGMAGQDVKLMGSAMFCTTSGQLVNECKARQDAYMVFDKMPRRYNTVSYLPHCNGVVRFGHVSVAQEVREVSEEMDKHLSEVLWPPSMHISIKLLLYWKHMQWPQTDFRLVNCDVTMLSCWLLFSSDWVEQQPWMPPFQIQVFTEPSLNAVVYGVLPEPEPRGLGFPKVFGKLFSHCPVQIWSFSAQVAVEAPWSTFMLIEIKGVAVHLRPNPWQFFCGYAAPVHLESSLSVNIMLVDSTQLCFGLCPPFYLGWVAVQSSEGVVQIVVWPILKHEISAANMEHFLVSVPNKGKLLNLDADYHKLISVLYVVLNTRELCDQVLALSQVEFDEVQQRYITNLVSPSWLVIALSGSSATKADDHQRLLVEMSAQKTGLLVFFEYELLMIDFTWVEDCVLPLPPLKIWHDFSGVHSVDSDYVPSVVPRSRVPLAWNSGGLEQIFYSWNLFLAHFEWHLAISPMFFKVSSNQCTCNCSAMHLELPWLFCWNYELIHLLGVMRNVVVVLLPQTFMLLPQQHDVAFFTVSNEQTVLPVTFAETGATLWIFAVVVWLSNWLCSCLLWKPPWELPALVEIKDVGLDDVIDVEDNEHEAKYVVPAKSTMSNAAAPLALPKDTGQLSKADLKKQTIVQFTWDPGGSILLHRLGGKPKLKKGGMSGTTHGWADI